MLTEERHKLILEELNKNSVVYVSELVKMLDTSESTIRRDLNSLNAEGKLKKVHGGATLVENEFNTKDDNLSIRENLNMQDKAIIAKYAASLVTKDDFVYIDSGTTTNLIIDYLEETSAVYVTNGINQAKRLIGKGFTTYIIAGELKTSTEAIVGVEAINSLRRYNFTKGFFGTNGISENRGFTTPDMKEALVKEEAIKRTRNAYILADKTKFNEISCITFAEVDEAIIITTEIEDTRYYDKTEIVEVLKL
ncbi:DeoR/GlpR transcriptional regulator [Clostridium sartagoforme]|uniref:DeoR/GlpR transcriptional regulator n=1 Tax=Clostridium sartagoforme TaxID=84031 RepID=A0A4S2DK97_9CLOT|nr:MULTISPECIES: DeoR/GlpR family DNA-binding transcription regulator [Clostridium]MDU5111239.1 DeoR/GlpR family DNA-binding transcription regulator [Clostridium sp.]TGY41361.1 DeoR/GlpR transcriptional regulator [Clostridium sartagoforme]